MGAGFEKLAERYRAIRRATEELADGLSPEDCAVQSMEDASPVKWHLAHTTWFFESFWLERCEAPHRPFRPEFRELFNSYYQAVAEPFARPHRGVLSRPGFVGGARLARRRRRARARAARELQRRPPSSSRSSSSASSTSSSTRS